MDAAYVSRDFFSIGLFGSYGKVFSALDKNHIMATGLVMEFRGCFSENMKVFPLLNVHIGRSWEYKKHYYTYGDNDEYRSEERRVGKECRSRWWAYYEKEKKREDM